METHIDIHIGDVEDDACAVFDQQMGIGARKIEKRSGFELESVTAQLVSGAAAGCAEAVGRRVMRSTISRCRTDFTPSCYAWRPTFYMLHFYR